jgi:NAD(P)-dependent dehydrogenase (short-subunit alcohol dehydrogenase family)
MNAPDAQKVAVITGASQGIGAGLVAGYRQAGYAVAGVALSMSPSDEEDYLAIHGDITEADTAQRVVDHALDRFGRVDTLINNAGIYIGKPFTDYTIDDYLAITAVNLAGFFHLTQRTIPQMVSRVAVTSSISPRVLWIMPTAPDPRRCPLSPKGASLP